MTHDVIVIGAGPAGMSAAIAASDFGLKTVLLDEQPNPGGQIYRNVAKRNDRIDEILGPDYVYGRQIVDELAKSSVELCLSSTVWDITRDFKVRALRNGQALQFRAPQLIVASGALERPSPLPGWTLPGVLNAGAAQIAMKSGASIPQGQVVLAGGGPLLLLVACQLLDAGAKVAAIVETSPASNIGHALPFMMGAIRSPRLLAKGLAMTLRLKKSGIPWYKAAEGLRVEGKERAEALSFTAGDRTHRLDADVVLLHHGVIPNTQISRLLHADHDWNAAQVAWQPRLDRFRETSVAGLRIAGDGGGIAGARAAEASGRLAAIGAAHALGRLDDRERKRLSGPEYRDLEAQLRIRPFLDALYRPPKWLLAPEGETIVCRCEETTADDIRKSVKLGSTGPNQTKFYNRCGMGPCQGRMCGPTVTQILTDELSVNPSEVGSYQVRSPLKPITLQQMASLYEAPKEKGKA